MAFSRKRKIDNIIGSNVKRIRRKKDPKMTQEYLANNIGLSRVTIANIESGKQGLTMVTLLNISKALGVPYTRILRGLR